jgi:hypothetical protein
MDEFVFILLAGIVLIGMFLLVWVPTEGAPIVEPSAVSLKARLGETRTFGLEISGNVSNVTLSSTGEISGWLTFNKNNFDVSKYPVTVVVKVDIPKTAYARTYTGTVVVRSTGGEKRIPVSIEITTVTTLSSRTIPIGDFSISFVTGGRTLDSKQNVEVSKGYFSEKYVNLVGLVEDREMPIVTGGYIKLVIEDTNNLANLIVSLNDQEMYSSKVNIGELKIPFDKSLIKRTNVVTIKTDTPGWMFWTSSYYKIKSVEIVANFEGTFTKDVPFSLEKEEIDKFDHFQLSARIRNHSTPMQELLIKVNDQLVFIERPPISLINITFSKDILGNSLSLKSDNVISFSIENPGFYDIANAVLTVFRRD